MISLITHYFLKSRLNHSTVVLIYAKNAGVDCVIMLMAQCGTVEKHFKANELQKSASSSPAASP